MRMSTNLIFRHSIRAHSVLVYAFLSKTPKNIKLRFFSCSTRQTSLPVQYFLILKITDIQKAKTERKRLQLHTEREAQKERTSSRFLRWLPCPRFQECQRRTFLCNYDRKLPRSLSSYKEKSFQAAITSVAV